MRPTGVTWFAVANDDIKAGEVVSIHVDRESGSTTVRKISVSDVNIRPPHLNWQSMLEEAERNQREDHNR